MGLKMQHQTKQSKRMIKTLVELCIGVIGILAVMVSFLSSEPNAAANTTKIWGTFEQETQVKLIFMLPKERTVFTRVGKD